MKKYPKEPGIILKRMRENHNLSIGKASSLAGISAPYLYRIEGGSCRPPDGSLLRKLLALYGDVKEKSYFESVRRERNQVETSSSPSSAKTQRPSRRQHRVIITPESQVLRYLRKRSGYSIRQASEALGFSGDGAYVSQIENGRANLPRKDKLDKFLILYGSSREEFEALLMKSDVDEISLRKGRLLFERLSEKNKCLIIQIMETLLA